MDTRATLVRNLASATTFERAADITLRATMELVDEALAASGLAGKGRMLRTMVHLRPDDGYVRLVALEAGEGKETGCQINQDVWFLYFILPNHSIR